MSSQPCGCDPEANHLCQRHSAIPSQFSLNVPVPTVSSGEVRVKDPITGGEKGQKIQRFSLIPREFLWSLATHYGIGARKYADRNWERGYKWSLSEDAVMRHYFQWRGKEQNDEETGTHHLICAIWHLIALFIFDTRKLGTDDIR